MSLFQKQIVGSYFIFYGFVDVLAKISWANFLWCGSVGELLPLPPPVSLPLSQPTRPPGNLPLKSPNIVSASPYVSGQRREEVLEVRNQIVAKFAPLVQCTADVGSWRHCVYEFDYKVTTRGRTETSCCSALCELPKFFERRVGVYYGGFST